MTPLTLLHLALMFHLIGLTLMAGTTFVEFISTNRFWLELKKNPDNGPIMRLPMSGWPRTAMVGIGLLIASGVSMMAITKGASGEQLWFRIKIALVIMLVLNGLIFGKRWHRAIDGLLKAMSSSGLDHPALVKVQKRVRVFHLSQLILLAIIIFLSTFKFN